MVRVLELVSLGRAARNNAQRKIRQPLAKLLVVGQEPLSDELTRLVLDELNVKEAVFEDSDRSLVDYSFKPQLRTLGRLMGGDLPAARPLIEALPGRATMDQLQASGSIDLTVGETSYQLTLEDLLVEEIPAAGYAVESGGAVKVALTTHLTPQLIEEGLVRELVSKIQTMRRTSGFDVVDRIVLYVKRGSLDRVVDGNADAIMTDVLADQLVYYDQGEDLPADVKIQEWDINGSPMTLAVARLTAV
jgi:isoleucyl-tRNA synthetase